MSRSWWGVVAALVCSARLAAAQSNIIIDQVLGSWQGDDSVQFVELLMRSNDQEKLANAADLVFDTAAGDAQSRRFFVFQQNLPRAGVAGARVLVGTLQSQTITGIKPDFVVEPGMIQPKNGRVCYRVFDGQGGATVVDCIAYGAFTGDTGPFGKPSRVTPDNRALFRIAVNGTNRGDWDGALSPVPANNAGQSFTMQTLCGDDSIAQGEECDGTNLGGATCASLGFAKGKVSCDQCHFDTRQCSFCGNDEINGDEECDGVELGDRTCETLGLTGGTLACTDKCTLTTAGCDATFFVPGGGPPKPDCLLEWQVMNAAQRPGSTGKAPPKQRCRVGDPGCDTGATPGSCTMPVKLCLSRHDARLAKCATHPVGSVQLVVSDAALATSLLDALAALGTATVAGDTVTFVPPVTDTGTCTAAVDVVLPSGGKEKITAKRTATGGKPKDADVLRLSCTP
jgi:hypothetical protein